MQKAKPSESVNHKLAVMCAYKHKIYHTHKADTDPVKYCC